MAQTVVLAFFNGTPLQMQFSQSECERMSMNILKERISCGETLVDISKFYLTRLTEIEEDMCLKANGKIMDLRKWAKHYEKQVFVELIRDWMCGVCILIKLKTINDDNDNGFVQMTGDLQVLPNARFVNVYDKCEMCGEKGRFKKCSGCKKVYYCNGACQKNHWKIHKPTCGM